MGRAYKWHTKKGIQVFLNNNLNLHPREQFCEFKKRYIIYITIRTKIHKSCWIGRRRWNQILYLQRKRRDSNLVFFSFFAFTFKRFWKKEPGVEPPEDLGGRESFTRSSSEKQQMWRSKHKWSIRQNRHMQYLLIFPSFPEENESGKREDAVSEMRVRPYQCHAVDSVNSTLLSLSQQPFCLFVLFWSDTQAH